MYSMQLRLRRYRSEIIFDLMILVYCFLMNGEGQSSNETGARRHNAAFRNSMVPLLSLILGITAKTEMVVHERTKP
jgi:hypothetical protein